jgi:uncharacterized membrane protein YkoI
MLFKHFFFSLIASSLLLLSVSTPLYAEPQEGVAPVQEGVSLKDATNKAEAQFGGEVLKAETGEEEGRPVYKIRLVNEGRVKDILIDSQTGDIIIP